MGLSVATRIAALPPADQAYLFGGLTDAEADALLHDWDFWARPEQQPPAGDWFGWLILAGRGFGKTRSGAEWVKARGLEAGNRRIALVAETFADGRDTMVEGESGLLSVLQQRQLRGGNVDEAWNRSLGELFLRNGSRYKIFSSEKPASLRGPQFDFAWGDEPAKWKDAHKGAWADETTWWNLLFGLRLGEHPRVMLTGTPKRVKLLVGDKQKPGLLGDARIVVTRGTSLDNLDNLAPSYRANVIDPLVGTRLGRQEINAEVLEDVEGALWTMAGIDTDRCDSAPELSRIVVAIDPAVTSNADSDETGVVVAGRGYNGEGYILEDLSDRVDSSVWARVAVGAYHRRLADKVVGEVNNGGDLIERVIRIEDPHVAYHKVTATRGKAVRAEPIQALYDKHLIHHVGAFPDLEDQMTTWVPSEAGKSPDRVDALVWALTELFLEGAEKPSVW